MERICRIGPSFIGFPVKHSCRRGFANIAQFVLFVRSKCEKSARKILWTWQFCDKPKSILLKGPN